MMKQLYKIFQVGFFSFLALTLVHCGTATDGGTQGSKFVEGATDSELMVPVLSIARSSNNITLTVEESGENTLSYYEIESKKGLNNDFKYLDETDAAVYLDANLSDGVYFYRVRSVHEKNGQMYFSNFSEVVSETIYVTVIDNPSGGVHTVN